jgi:hypothetical protein
LLFYGGRASKPFDTEAMDDFHHHHHH